MKNEPLYRGNTGMIAAAALDLAEEIGLERGTIEIDFCRERGRAVVSIVNRSSARIVDTTEKEKE